MIRLTPGYTRTDTLFPSPSLCRAERGEDGGGPVRAAQPGAHLDSMALVDGGQGQPPRPGRADMLRAQHGAFGAAEGDDVAREAIGHGQDPGKIGGAHVWTPVTNAQLVCRLLLEKKNAPDKRK